MRRERAAGIRFGSPFMTDPTGMADPTLTAYFNSPRFARLAKSTKLAYTGDYVVFFNFLWQRNERRWTEATVGDVEDYEDWRNRGPSNPRTIGGSKWARELAALNRLYKWAVQEQVLETSPIRTVASRGRDGEKIEVVELSPTSRRVVDMKWLTPRLAERWRDVGLRGLSPDGSVNPAYRGRNADRNAAFFDLLFDSGLRLTEASSLLSMELPTSDGVNRMRWGRVAKAAAKNGSGRPFAVTERTLSSIRSYVATSRDAAVRSAQAKGRFDDLPGKLHVQRILRTARGTSLQWWDESSRVVRTLPVDRIDVEERMRLFSTTERGLEPMWLWLSERGTPFQPHSWEDVFSSGTLRCQRALGDEAPFCTPHMLRHSFALVMLVALQHAYDERFGLTPEQRRDFAILYRDPWRIVKDLLGHSSEETTREIYLAPVRDVQVRTLLENGVTAGADFLRALAAAGGSVLDLATDE